MGGREMDCGEAAKKRRMGLAEGLLRKMGEGE
jgi:hypothetical protein